MNFKTLRTAETGKKFAEVEKKIELVCKAAKDMADDQISLVITV